MDIATIDNAAAAAMIATTLKRGYHKFAYVPCDRWEHIVSQLESDACIIMRKKTVVNGRRVMELFVKR